jgi:Zn-dependent peptidase ImmA (M78 family)
MAFIMNENIIRKARRLVRQCETTDPFRIAREAGAEIFFRDLGKLKGMYACIKRNRYIVINQHMNAWLQKLVCAHELGHDQFHRELAANRWMHEFMLYNMNQRSEYEANVFAAELLLRDADVIELSDGGLDIEQIARSLYSDVNLVALKLGLLSQRGYRFRQFDYKSDFLKA